MRSISKLKGLTLAAALVLALIAGWLRPVTSLADGGTISLSTTKTVYKQGEVFTVVCRVSASTGVLEADFYVDYNTSVLKFIEGGTKAEKEVGGVHIVSEDNTDSPVRRTYSLQFMAAKEGDASVFIRNGARVVDGEGNPLSLRTAKIDIAVNLTGEEEGEGAEGAPGLPSAPPDDKAVAPGESAAPGKLSNNNKVKEIYTNATDMVPEFDPTIRAYDVVVDADTSEFFIDYTLANKYATAKVRGNRNLKFGINKVKLTVTAQSGKKRTYVFMVERLSKKNTPSDPPATSGAAVGTDIPLDKDNDKGYSIVLYLIIALLAVFSIAMVVLVRRQRRELYDYYEEEEEREKRIETKDDSGSGEGYLERGEIRGEDGKFDYRD